ncbi:MAG TPA: hypothetical protein VI913_04015 [Candidatus Peribacteraceae bacterium]|nr:hypothetical protein [Candidatus Peribacteraceae bacterium]
MNQLQALQNARRGSSPLGILFIFIFILILLFLFDMAFIFGSQNCIDEDVFSCALDMLTSDEEEEEQQGGVTATGVISGTYGKSERSVTVTLTFPLEGGNVTGSFSGDCDGNIKGTFAGGNGGAISGKAKGSCAFIFPASADFSGTVSQRNKTVSVSGKGSAAGFSGEGSLTLKY